MTNRNAPAIVLLVGELYGLVDRLKCSCKFIVTSLEPVGRPDPMKSPAKRLEVLLPKSVTVSSSRRGVVRRTVAFNCEHESPRLVRVERDKIQPVRGCAVLTDKPNTCRRKRVADGLLELIEG